ncbi:hypothetical protein [Phenylobacterium deserti]|uniref:Methyltransferase type 11 n=1 Tax=Phenylobacterium deserti TaxID=1914756 RepID=A0A328ACB5_9CAUL|nr:hypothetical protein [Phenylobacterium deserti]RAK52290.1 hypothetical protein DJ018_14210 [Phenylobacterium deserti]
MKTLLIMTACTLALGAAACTPNERPVARAALDCPEKHEGLTRVSVAGDRKSCTYRSNRGDEVVLQLLPTQGDPRAALQGLEAQLVPASTTAPLASPDENAQAASEDARKAAEEASADAAAAVDAGDGPEEVHVGVGGIGVHVKEGADGAQDKADIRLPGIHINAQGDRADINVAGVQINADGEDATVRMFRNVRLKGEAFSREKRGVRATYVRTGENLPGGARTIGYEAGGPATGPLTVAVIRAREGEHDGGDDLFKAVQDLVRRNGGV